MRNRRIPETQFSQKVRYELPTEFSLNRGFDADRYLDKHKLLGNSKYTKAEIERALVERNIPRIREMSKYLYGVSGMYKRAVKYVSLAPTYSYILTPYVFAEDIDKRELVLEMDKALEFVDSLGLQSQMPKIFSKIVKEGVFYGYFRKNESTAVIQELPTDYCRSEFTINGFPAVEFNIRYFDEKLKHPDTKLAVIRTYPQEIQNAYIEWQQNRTEGFDTRYGGVWVLLNPDHAIKLSMEEDDSPLFSNAMTSIIDLDNLLAIDKAKAEQQLAKILYQKVPLDKNGDFIFDMEEAGAMHENAVNVLGNSANMDVLTGFADLEVHDTTSSNSDFDNEKWTKTTYSELGISGQLFATEGNLALEKSIITDEALIFQLLSDFERWINYQLSLVFSNEGYKFKVWFPPITHYNKVEMSKIYKDQATLGYSKMLPTIALGQSQLNFINTAVYENSIVGLNRYMEPLASSYTSSTGSSGEAGRPEKSDSEKSDKTIANKNAM